MVRAIDIVRIALETFGAPIYVRKEIVHNRYVVDELSAKGAIFVDSVEEVPAGERVIYSAHGVAPEVRESSKLRELRVIDATCPLVTKVHVEAVKFAREGYSLILIGHRDHDEVIGTLGEAPAVTQVVDAPGGRGQSARARSGPRGLSDADHVEPRRNPPRDRGAAQEVPQHQGPARAGHLLRDGEPPDGGEGRRQRMRSAAGGGLGQQLEFEPAGRSGVQSGHEVVISSRTTAPFEPEWLQNVKTVGLTAGASAPEILVQEVVDFLAEQGFTNMREVEVMPEHVRFGLPPEIVEAIGAAPAVAE